LLAGGNAAAPADIPAHFRFPPGTHRIEGINHTIGFTKRLPRCFRDGACFFLRIAPLSPEPGDEPKKKGPPKRAL